MRQLYYRYLLCALKVLIKPLPHVCNMVDACARILRHTRVYVLTSGFMQSKDTYWTVCINIIDAHCVTCAVSRTDVILLLTYCVMPSDGAAELCGPQLILSISSIAIEVALFYVSSYCANSIQSNSIVTARNRARGPLALAVHNVVH